MFVNVVILLDVFKDLEDDMIVKVDIEYIVFVSENCEDFIEIMVYWSVGVLSVSIIVDVIFRLVFYEDENLVRLELVVK